MLRYLMHARGRTVLIAVSTALALAQATMVPADVHHHTDSGFNVFLHVLGPLVLGLVPVISSLVLAFTMLARRTPRALHVPSFVGAVLFAEASGAFIGAAHHGVASTLLLALVSAGVSLVGLLLGAGIVRRLRSRHAVAAWSHRRASASRPVTFARVLRRELRGSAHALRGPPSLTRV